MKSQNRYNNKGLWNPKYNNTIGRTLPKLLIRDTPDPNPPKIEKPKPQRIPGQGHYGPKTISFEEVQAMREEHKNGAKPKEISKKFGHGYCYVLQILNFEARVWG